MKESGASKKGPVQTIHIACSTGGEGEGERSSGALHQHDSRWYPLFYVLTTPVCVCERERESERERQRERDRQSERETERDREREGGIVKDAYGILSMRTAYGILSMRTAL